MAEARYPSVYVDKLGQQLRVWERYGITDSHAMKLLRLWLGFGLTQYMDIEGRYTFHSFNQLRQLLGYPGIVQMLEDIRRSRSFVLLACDIEPSKLRDGKFFAPSRPNREFPDRLTAFYSPLWKERNESDGEALEGSIPESQKNCQTFDGLNSNTLYSNTLSGGTATAAAASEAASNPSNIASVEQAERQETMERIAAAKIYFRSLIHNSDSHQREPIEYLMWRLQQPERADKGKTRGFGLSAEQAQEVIGLMIDYELAPHFARDRSFMSPSHVAKPENRIYQVTPFIKRYSSEMQSRAVSRWRKQQAVQEQREARCQANAIRQNRPLSPHEWQEPDGSRYYEDAADGIVLIPADAAPRPTEDAHWNRFAKAWKGPTANF